MYEDKFQELDRLKRKNNIGVIIMLVLIILTFVGPAVIQYIPFFDNLPEDLTLYIVGTIVVGIVLIIITFIKLCSPYNKLSTELTKEIKNNLMKQELNSTFNNTYREENSDTFLGKITELKIVNHLSNMNDCFSADYNNVRFNYGNLELYHYSDDSTITDFEGPVFEFYLNKELEGDLYIGTKEKIIFGHFSDLEHLLDYPECVEVKPDNSILKEEIILKSNLKPSIINSSSFQEVINEIMNDKQYILIYKNMKLYVLIYNDEDPFEIAIRGRKDEEKAKEQIRNEVNKLRSELDTILRYKDVLNIKDKTF